MNDRISWWNKLPHNRKKQLLVNFDFNERFGNDFDTIRKKLYRAHYDAYFLEFQQRIRRRMDAFEATEASLERLLGIQFLAIACSDDEGLQILSRFTRLAYLCVSAPGPGFFAAVPAMRSVRVLEISGGKIDHLDGISGWTGLAHVTFWYCTALENFRDLNRCPGLRTADLRSRARTADISCLTAIPSLTISKRMIHCDDAFYNRKYNALKCRAGMIYTLDPAEMELLSANPDPVVRNNFDVLIVREQLRIVLESYMEWTLVRSDQAIPAPRQGATEQVPKKPGGTLTDRLRRWFS